MGTKVAENDLVEVDGKAVVPETRMIHVALNKPAGYICSASDPQGRPLARNLLEKSITERVYTVGRLDLRSSGLILFTNDGSFSAHIGHPSAEIEKEYVVDSTVPIPDSLLNDFLSGIELDGEVYRCVEIERLGRKSVRVILIEGKNREIRRVFSAFHVHPERLIRVRIGPIWLGSLPEGASRTLSPAEIDALLISSSGGMSHDSRD
jgi:23S rRNA pseudouridine2605 synthase